LPGAALGHFQGRSESGNIRVAVPFATVTNAQIRRSMRATRPSCRVMSFRWFPLIAVVAVACAQVDSPNPEMVLPVDYRTTYVPVRACRSSVDHPMAMVVFTPPEVADIYDAGPYPFPVGALVVVEQYRDSGCMDLQEYGVMKKREEGYDPGNGDWQWYRLDIRQHVAETGKIARCAACHKNCGQTRDRVCAAQ
jgi:hypothetical protein